MTYKQFKKSNDESKGAFPVLGRVLSTNMKAGTCVFIYEGNITRDLPIKTLVNNIVYDGMGAISNPSALASWGGFDK